MSGAKSWFFYPAGHANKAIGVFDRTAEIEANPELLETEGHFVWHERPVEKRSPNAFQPENICRQPAACHTATSYGTGSLTVA